MIVPGIVFVQGRNSYSDADGKKYGIAIHNTSNNASDTAELLYATRRTDGTSSHFYCDADSIGQSLDTNAKAGHAGSKQGNENAIAVEITGANGWTREQWLADVAWDKLVAVLRQVIAHHWPDGSFQVRRASVAEMQSNPKVKAVYGHDDMRRAWGGTDHADPGPNFPWDHLLALLADVEGEDMTPEQAKKLDVIAAEVDTINGRVFAMTQGTPKVEWGGLYGTAAGEPNAVQVALTALSKQVADLTELVKKLAALGGPGGASAEAVADELAKRLQS